MCRACGAREQGRIANGHVANVPAALAVFALVSRQQGSRDNHAGSAWPNILRFTLQHCSESIQVQGVRGEDPGNDEAPLPLLALLACWTKRHIEPTADSRHFLHLHSCKLRPGSNVPTGSAPSSRWAQMGPAVLPQSTFLLPNRLGNKKNSTSSLLLPLHLCSAALYKLHKSSKAPAGRARRWP